MRTRALSGFIAHFPHVWCDMVWCDAMMSLEQKRTEKKELLAKKQDLVERKAKSAAKVAASK